MSKPRLTDEEIDRRISGLESWRREGDKLVADFKFKSFVDAFSWMASIALVAEKLDHHPEWTNVYNRVHVELITHDAGGITALDFNLAGRMSELARRYVA